MRSADKESVNDRAKLMMHRLIARRLARDAGLLDLARTAVIQLAREYPDRSFPAEWAAILELPAATVRRRLTSRAEDMQRLRLSSPFITGNSTVFLEDPDLRRRIWRLARRGAFERDRDASAPA